MGHVFAPFMFLRYSSGHAGLVGIWELRIGQICRETNAEAGIYSAITRHPRIVFHCANG